VTMSRKHYEEIARAIRETEQSARLPEITWPCPGGCWQAKWIGPHWPDECRFTLRNLRTHLRARWYYSAWRH